MKKPYDQYIFGEKIRAIRTFLGGKFVQSIHFWRKNPYNPYFLFVKTKLLKKIRTIRTIFEKREEKQVYQDENETSKLG